MYLDTHGFIIHGNVILSWSVALVAIAHHTLFSQFPIEYFYLNVNLSFLDI
jgi:hypothetical protein